MPQSRRLAGTASRRPRCVTVFPVGSTKTGRPLPPGRRSDAAEQRPESEPPAPPRAIVERGHERCDPAAAAKALPAATPAQTRAVIGQQLGEERMVAVAEARQRRRVLQPRGVEIAMAPPVVAEAAVQGRRQRAPHAAPWEGATEGEAALMLAIGLEILVEIPDA